MRIYLYMYIFVLVFVLQLSDSIFPCIDFPRFIFQMHLQQMVMCQINSVHGLISVMKNIAEEFVDNLLHLDYKTLSQLHKRVFGKVMTIVPQIRSTNLISRRIFDQSHLHYQKNKDAPLIRKLKKEKVVLQSGLSIMAHIESQKRKVRTIEKGVARIVTVSAPYMCCVTCDVIKTHPNFIRHKCCDAQLPYVVDII